MDTRKRLILYFSIAGVLGGAAVMTVFSAWLGMSNTSQLLFGLEQPYFLVLIPILAAVVAGFWASGAPVTEFGPLRGAFLGVLALLSVVAILGVFRGSSLADRLMFVLVFMFFGFTFVGWAAMLLGALTGWLFKHHTQTHANDRLVRTPGNKASCFLNVLPTTSHTHSPPGGQREVNGSSRNNIKTANYAVIFTSIRTDGDTATTQWQNKCWGLFQNNPAFSASRPRDRKSAFQFRTGPH